jgi:hypothetical protein
MRWKQIENAPKIFLLVFATDDEIANVLQQFARDGGLGGSSFEAIGALSYAKLGWFNWESNSADCSFLTSKSPGNCSEVLGSRVRWPRDSEGSLQVRPRLERRGRPWSSRRF